MLSEIQKEFKSEEVGIELEARLDRSCVPFSYIGGIFTNRLLSAPHLNSKHAKKHNLGAYPRLSSIKPTNG